MEVRVFFDGTGCPLSSNPWIGEVERERIGLFRGIGLYEGGRASNFKLCFQRKIKFLKPARTKESHLFVIYRRLSYTAILNVDLFQYNLVVHSCQEPV